MTFAAIPAGSSVFVDANTFVYHFTAHAAWGPAASDLLDRVEQGDMSGFTSTHILSEVAHRLMTIEASQKFGWPFQGIANRCRRAPNEVQQI